MLLECEVFGGKDIEKGMDMLTKVVNELLSENRLEVSDIVEKSKKSIREVAV